MSLNKHTNISNSQAALKFYKDKHLLVSIIVFQVYTHTHTQTHTRKFCIIVYSSKKEMLHCLHTEDIECTIIY